MVLEEKIRAFQASSKEVSDELALCIRYFHTIGYNELAEDLDRFGKSVDWCDLKSQRMLEILDDYDPPETDKG